MAAEDSATPAISALGVTKRGRAQFENRGKMHTRMKEIILLLSSKRCAQVHVGFRARTCCATKSRLRGHCSTASGSWSPCVVSVPCLKAPVYHKKWCRGAQQAQSRVSLHTPRAVDVTPAPVSWLRAGCQLPASSAAPCTGGLHIVRSFPRRSMPARPRSTLMLAARPPCPDGTAMGPLHGVRTVEAGLSSAGPATALQQRGVMLHPALEVVGRMLWG